MFATTHVTFCRYTCIHMCKEAYFVIKNSCEAAHAIWVTAYMYPTYTYNLSSFFSRLSSILLIKTHLRTYPLGVSNCDIFRLSWFWNITYHDSGNNYDYGILKTFEDKLMQKFKAHNKFHDCCISQNFITLFI